VIDSGVAGKQRPEVLRGADFAVVVSRQSEGAAGVLNAQTALRRLGARDVSVITIADSTPRATPAARVA